MIKKGTRYLLLPLLFVSMCVYAGALLFKPVKHIGIPSFKPAPLSKVAKMHSVARRAFAGQITDFVIPVEIAPAAIDQAHGIIGIAVHAGQDITNLTPTITVTPGSTVTPASGVPNDFTNAPLYTVDPLTTPVHYNIQVFHAAIASGCSNVPTNLTGTPSAPAGTYEWQILDENTHTWSAAPAPNGNLNYTTQPIVNNTSAGVLYTFRRAITTMVGTAYDSYTDLTVEPVIPITGNTITQPSAANSTFCVSGDPGTIQGNPAGGGDGNPQYQWQSSVGGAPFGNIPGATGQNYTPPTITATTKFQRVVKSGNCNTPTTSNQVTITILPAITNNHLSPPGTTTFCGISTPTIINGTNPPSGGAGSGTFQYQWQSSTDGTHFTDISGGANGNDYDAPALTQTTYFQRLAKSGACSAWVPSDNVVVITIQPGLAGSNITATGPTTFCGPATPGLITGDLTTGGDGTPVYQWESSPDGGTYQPINGATGKDFSPPQISATIYYRRTVKSGSCSTPLISAPVTFTIQPALSGNNITATGPTVFCGSGTPARITGDPTTGGDGTPVYQWESSPDGGTYQPINGANGQNFDPPQITSTIYYRRTVKSGSCTTALISSAVMFNVQPALSANTITPTGTTSFCATGDPTVINGSPVTGGDGTPVYQWESSTDGSNYQPINSTNQQNYDPPPVSVTTYFRRQVSSGSCSPPTPSTPVTITVTPPITANVIHADNTMFCASTGTFTITGDPPAGGDGSYTYKWQSSTDGISYQLVNGAISASYDSPSLTETTWFERIVSSGSCNGTSISTPVKITVQTVLAGNTLTPPPVSAFCGPGDAAPITGTIPTGGDGSPSYQWQQSADNVDAHFTNISGVSGSGKDFDPPSLNSTMFYRRVITEQTCSTPLISTAVEIHITQPLDPAKNHITPPLTTTFCTSYDPNTIIGTFGAVNPPSGVDAIVYQWYKSTDNGAQWIPITVNGNSPDYDPDPITVTTWYRRTVQSGACSTPINSVETVKLNIIPSPPNITITPAAPVCAGESATLAIASPDAALTYNWYDTPTKDNLLFQGPVFKTVALTANQTFYAEASNGTCSSPQLASADVTVNPLPDLPVLADAEPAGCKGSPLVLTVSNPQNGVTYNWYSAATGGQSLFTGPNFTTPVLTNDVTYYVDATSSSGCVSPGRASAVITVYPLPVTVAQGANICPGTIATLTANNQDLDQTINWYDAPTGGILVGTGSPFKTPVLNTGTTYYAEAVNTVSGCISATRSAAKVQILTPLDAPVVRVIASAAPKMIFAWAPVNGAVAYLVSTDNGISYTDPSSGPDGTSHTVTGLQVGQTATIIVRALGNSSCETSADSRPVMGIATDPDIDKIFVANAFTPNGDGKNDIVYVHNDNIKSLKFSVYDQWGNMLFQSLSPQKGWDGTYKGKLQPVGVYVYYLEAVMDDGQPVTKKGTITLLR